MDKTFGHATCGGSAACAYDDTGTPLEILSRFTRTSFLLRGVQRGYFSFVQV